MITTVRQRNMRVDAIKGILIIFVVIGHAIEGLLHDIIYMFHMPLFFILSGVFFSERNVENKQKYIKKITRRLLVPYIFYLVFNGCFFDDAFTLKALIRCVWGGRFFYGTYWYMTALFFSLCIYIVILQRQIKLQQHVVVGIFAIIAIIESNSINRIPLLLSPGVPWNFDVCLLAVLYIHLGFVYKKQIWDFINNENCKSVMILCSIAFIVVFLLLNNFWLDNSFWYMDMKHVQYKGLILSILVPSAFGVIIVSFVNCLPISFISTLAYIGRNTIPIMFLHISINHSFNINNDFVTYLTIGIIIPLILAFIASKNKYTSILLGVIYNKGLKQNPHDNIKSASKKEKK